MYAVPEAVAKLTVRPEVEGRIAITDTEYRNAITLAQWNTVPQHRHPEGFDHKTRCLKGAARYWIDNQFAGEIKAGEEIVVQGGHQHLFQAIAEGETELECVWELALAERMLELLEREG